MSRRVSVKYIRNMTPQERKICANMSYRANGDLLGWMNVPNKDDRVCIVRDGDKIVGWAIRRENGNTGYWTRVSERRKGIGSVMVRRLEKLGHIRVYPHDGISERFFEKNKQTDIF